MSPEGEPVPVPVPRYTSRCQGSVSPEAVAGPVAVYLIAGDKAGGPLAAVKQFMSDHNAAIMAAILLVLGAKLIGNGIAGLSN